MRPKTVLFLCTGNSCRSQMAEGFARAIFPADWKVYSAGVRADGMNEYAIGVMAETGIDISRQWSKTIDELKGITPDIVITLCDKARDNCPVLPGKHIKEHWPIADPADTTGREEEILSVYRSVRDEIKTRIERLYEHILSS